MGVSVSTVHTHYKGLIGTYCIYPVCENSADQEQNAE